MNKDQYDKLVEAFDLAGWLEDLEFDSEGNKCIISKIRMKLQQLIVELDPNGL